MATIKSKSLDWKHYERIGEKAKCSLCISGNILSAVVVEVQIPGYSVPKDSIPVLDNEK